MKYSYKDIDCIDSEGISLYGSRKILFEICMREYQKIYPESTKCIGVRDITGNPPYFEFFMPEHIKIVFDRKGLFGKRKNLNDFHRLYTTLFEYSCRTYDLS